MSKVPPQVWTVTYVLLFGVWILVLIMLVKTLPNPMYTYVPECRYSTLCPVSTLEIEDYK